MNTFICEWDREMSPDQFREQAKRAEDYANHCRREASRFDGIAKMLYTKADEKEGNRDQTT
jgi:hypothetical protein